MRRDTDLPQPADVTPVKGPALWRWIIGGVVVIGLAIAAFTVPIPVFFAYQPGPVESVEPLVSIGGARTYSSEGDLLMTTVSVDINVTFAELIQAAIDRSSSVVLREDVTQGQDIRDLETAQQRAMQESKRAAETVALAHLGVSVPESDGVKVEAALQGYPAAGLLEEGDVIVRVEGRAVRTTCDVSAVIDGRRPGDDISFTVRRQGRRREVDLTATRNPNDPEAAFAGIQMSNIGYRFEPEVNVEVDTGRIAGPSGGLMMTLAIYDRLTSDDLTGGRRIAGTGEIDVCGAVRPIGGIEQKVAGAEREGADLFLAPEGNFEAARRSATSIEVLSVGTFDEALESLTQGEGRTG